MSWYKKAQVGPIESTLKIPDFDQKVWSFTTGDYQRWVIDTYETRLYLTKTAKMVVISLNIWNWHNSTMVFQDFWKFKVSEETKAKTVFANMIKAAQTVLEKFMGGENSDTPNNLLFPSLRTACWNVNRDNLAKTNIPHINYARQKGNYESDWRKSLYGNRYPTGETSGF
jgi:hypothetical protein